MTNIFFLCLKVALVIFFERLIIWLQKFIVKKNCFSDNVNDIPKSLHVKKIYISQTWVSFIFYNWFSDHFLQPIINDFLWFRFFAALLAKKWKWQRVSTLFFGNIHMFYSGWLSHNFLFRKSQNKVEWEFGGGWPGDWR